MNVILHKLHVDPVTLRATIVIQFSESGLIETRHATYVTVGDNGWKLDCEDDLIDKLQKIAAQAGLRSGALMAELLLHARDALYNSDRLRFPITLKGFPPKPAPARSIWGKLRSLCASKSR